MTWRMVTRSPLTALLWFAASAACSATSPQDPGTNWLTLQDAAVTFRYVAADADVVISLRDLVRSGSANASAFLGLPYPEPLTVEVAPSWDQFVGRFRENYRVSPECGTLGAALRTTFQILTPRVWRTKPCPHDPDRPGLLSRAVWHELIHVLHMQQQLAQRPEATNFYPTPRWIIEGLAVYGSGQLDTDFAGYARSRLQAGFAPTTLAEVSNDPHLFGLAGSLVGYIDALYGRATMGRLVRVRTDAEALAVMGADEATLVSGWRQSVLH